MLEIIDYLYQKVSNDDKIVVAVSGGPDSMFLLEALINVRKLKNIDIIVAHVNHNVRIESLTEAAWVKEYTIKNNLIFEYMVIEKYNDKNFHEDAREKRYHFFEGLVQKYGAKYLMTAHHGDDLMETILMRIVRGSTLLGYAGFKEEVKFKDYTLLRPLITITKKEIEDYMDSKKLWYAIDASNMKDIYTRNRYRKYILPRLKDEDKNVHKKFLKFSRRINEVGNFFENYVNKKYKQLKKDELNVNKLLKEDEIVIKSILSKYLIEVYKDNIHLVNDKHIDCIYNLLASTKTNIIIDIPGNYKFVKSYDKAYIIENKKHINYKYELNKDIYIEDYGNVRRVDIGDDTSNNTTYLNSKDIKLPLYVRNRRQGDKMIVKNMKSSKKLKDIFIECKVAIDKRDNYPIVVDDNDDIVWIPGLKKSKFDRKNDGKYDIILKYD